MVKVATRQGKRSRNVRLLSMLTATSMLAACGEEPSQAPVASTVEPGSVEVQAFGNVFECSGEGGLSKEECAAAHKQAVARSDETAPRYAGHGDCEADWGGGGCIERTVSGTSFFMPFVTGFLVGKLLPGGKREYSPLFRRAGGDQTYFTANGTKLANGASPTKFFAGPRAFEQPRSVPAIKANSGAIARGGMAARSDDDSSGGSTRWGSRAGSSVARGFGG